MSYNKNNTNNQDNAKTIYEQYWSQARHIENERLWLTNIFAVVFAALLGFITMGGTSWYIPIFGLFLSIVGLVAMHDLRIWYIRYSRLAEKIAINELDGERYDVGKFRKNKGKSSMKIGRFWGLHPVFMYFYSAMFALWIAILLYELNIRKWLWLIFIIILCSFLSFYQFVILPREKRMEKEIIGGKKS